MPFLYFQGIRLQTGNIISGLHEVNQPGKSFPSTISLSSFHVKRVTKELEEFDYLYLVAWKTLEKFFFFSQRVGAHRELGHEQKICVKSGRFSFHILLRGLCQILGTCSTWIICSVSFL